MAIYRFPEFNVDIEDPELQIVFSDANPKILGVDVTDLTYTIEIRLVSGGATFGYTLDKVQAESLDWAAEGANMRSQIWTRLEDFKID